MAPIVSVVVPTRDRLARLKRLLDQLAKQIDPGGEIEIVVVDDGSLDGTPAFLSEWAQAAPGRRVERLTGCGPAAARNAGVHAATAPLIAFTDDDCIPEPGWLAGLVAALNDHPEFDAVGGQTQPSPEAGFIGRYIDFDCVMRRPETIGGEVLHLQTNNQGIRRKVFVSLGGFSLEFRTPGGEDWEFSHRMRRQGSRLGYAPEAVIVHDHRHTVRSFARTYFNYGRGEAIMLASEPWLRQFLRGVWRLRFFAAALLIPVNIIKNLGASDLSFNEKLGFFLLRALRQTAHQTGFARELPGVLWRRPLLKGDMG